MYLDVPDGALRARKYKAVFFDAGNTLFYVHPSVGAVYAEVAREFGAQLDPETVDQLFHAEINRRDGGSALSAASSPAEERAWWGALVEKVVTAAGGVPRFPEYMERLFQVFATRPAWRVFPEVETVLAECGKRGVLTGIISNWDSRLPEICRTLGLADYFRFILASAAVGVAKPNPAIFHMALTQAGVSASEALHIGDLESDDVQGARAAGLDAILLDRRNLSPRPNVAVTDSLQAILEFC